MHLSRIASFALLGVMLMTPIASADDPPTPSPAPSAAPSVTPEPSPATSQQALFRLLRGNTRYYENRSAHANQGAFARSQQTKQEYPWAIVVTCSDSRVPPEIVFDQGLGQITVLRAWGNFVGDTAVGSIQHALEDHGPNLIVVLGHSRCRALKSALDHKPETGAAAKIVGFVAPAIAAARKLSGDVLDNACKENARMVVRRLLTYPFVAQRVKAGKLRVVPAFYDLDSGHVKVLNTVKTP